MDQVTSWHPSKPGCSPWRTRARRARRLTRPRTLATLASSLLLAGCAAAGSPCQGASTSGWFSGWGGGGASAFTVGLGRSWGECPCRDRRSVPALSADPASEPFPGALAPPR